jgi:hypothetical protein
MTREAQDRRREIQAVVWLDHHSHQHPDRMRGNTEEASVITARIREAHIEVPVVAANT